jgi:hypothetical protein
MLGPSKPADEEIAFYQRYSDYIDYYRSRLARDYTVAQLVLAPVPAYAPIAG